MTCMWSMEDRAERLGQITPGVDDSRDMLHDDISSLGLVEGWNKKWYFWEAQKDSSDCDVMFFVSKRRSEEGHIDRPSFYCAHANECMRPKNKSQRLRWSPFSLIRSLEIFVTTIRYLFIAIQINREFSPNKHCRGSFIATALADFLFTPEHESYPPLQPPCQRWLEKRLTMSSTRWIWTTLLKKSISTA